MSKDRRGWKYLPILLAALLACFEMGGAYAQSLASRSEEQALFQMDAAPPLPENIKETADLVVALAMGDITLLDLNTPIEVPEEVIETNDIEYAKTGDTSVFMDLYQPKNATGPLPALVFIHGGGWESGKRSDYKYYCVRFPLMGYVAVTISYRMVGDAVFPACVEDVKCAVRWLRAHADEYGIDPNAIAAVGGSAGGHLAMMLGYSADVPSLEGSGGNADYSSAVQAVVDLYGPVDMTLEEVRDNKTLQRLFGGKSYDEVPEQYQLASPLTHVKEGIPPTLIIHGTDDDTVPVAQADLLAERLKGLGCSYEYLRLEGYPHTLDLIDAANRHVRWHIYHFLDKVFKK